MPNSIANIIAPLAKKAVGKDWPLYTTLLDRWAEIVGAEFAEVTAPIKITFPHQPTEAIRQNGTLTIRLPKGLAMEFSYKAELIRQRVNSYFGYPAFAKIALDPVYTLPRKASAPKAADAAAHQAIVTATADIVDSDLKSALEGLGKAVMAEKP